MVGNWTKSLNPRKILIVPFTATYLQLIGEDERCFLVPPFLRYFLIAY